MRGVSDLGELVVHNPTGLDPSVTNLYTINVTVMDKEGFTDSGLLTIRVVDITDVPEIWNLPMTIFVKESVKPGLKIFHARTIDMINGTLIYNMTVSPDDRKFRITYKGTPTFKSKIRPSTHIGIKVAILRCEFKSPYCTV